MFTFNSLIAVCLLYVGFLFFVAFAAERSAARGGAGWLRSPVIYTLSLSVYCTAWTFYGAVGYAARSGLEFVTIYLGPTIVMIGWWWLLRRLVRIGRAQRITSIADLISSRYGKSNLLGVIVTILAVIGTTPYIALQLQSVTLSLEVFRSVGGGSPVFGQQSNTAILIAIGLAFFTILFGTRNLDVNERHHGVVIAIALEAVVKLIALLAVGGFVVWGVSGGTAGILRQIDQSAIASWDVQTSRWITITFLSGAAFLCLPRMFQVMVVENADENHIATASWAFPLYLFLMSLFVVPIAVVGLAILPEGSNPDLFVLTLPLALEADSLAALAFLGGFSSATSMVIVAAIALSTMVSNHIVAPLWLSFQREGATMSGDIRNVILFSRRATIAGVLALGYFYYRLSGGGAALASIGLISFTGVAQVLPALVGALFWRGATRTGAAIGLVVGFFIWAYTMFLPSFGPGEFLSASLMGEGPFGISWLRPRALFGTGAFDPLVHAVFWSMAFNTLAFFVGSVLTFPGPLERFQGAHFVDAFDRLENAKSWAGRGAEAEDLLIMTQRIIGADEAQTLFQAAAAGQGRQGFLPDVTPDFITRLERELTGSVGAATAHAMLGQITGGSSVTVENLMAVADETAQMLEYSSQLEAKSQELSKTAGQLREANEKLTELSLQQDAFLSQVSHELRTPMTSIRSFSEILIGHKTLDAGDRQRYYGIIHEEAQRLTRLLDNLLDLSVLESGGVTLNLQHDDLRETLGKAVSASGSDTADDFEIRFELPQDPCDVSTDHDRLLQVFINLISNARKYCVVDAPVLHIILRHKNNAFTVDFVDNGPGIPKEAQSTIFEKFARASDHAWAGSAGLGLAICRDIMKSLGGSIEYLPGQGGAAFRVRVPD